MKYQKAMEVVRQAVAQGKIICASAAVWDSENGIEQGAFGVLSPSLKQAADTETRFDLASLTKVVVTTPLLLGLSEKGKLSLSDRVCRYFPGFVCHGKGEITLLDLAVHISGLPGIYDFTKDCRSTQDAVKIICDLPVKEDRRRRVEYSDLGFILLGAIVEKVNGETLPDLAQREIFRPLGMTRTGYLPKPGNIACTEFFPDLGDCLCGMVHDENTRAFGGVSGHAGLFGTAEDICRYGQALVTGKTPSGGKFLSVSSRFVMRTSFTIGLSGTGGLPGQGRAVGFQVNYPKSGEMPPESNGAGESMSENAFGHTGFTGTSLWMEPELRRVFVLLTNRVCPSRNNPSVFRLRRDFHNAALQIQ